MNAKIVQGVLVLSIGLSGAIRAQAPVSSPPSAASGLLKSDATTASSPERAAKHPKKLRRLKARKKARALIAPGRKTRRRPVSLNRKPVRKLRLIPRRIGRAPRRIARPRIARKRLFVITPKRARSSSLFKKRSRILALKAEKRGPALKKKTIPVAVQEIGKSARSAQPKSAPKTHPMALTATAVKETATHPIVASNPVTSRFSMPGLNPFSRRILGAAGMLTAMFGGSALLLLNRRKKRNHRAALDDDSESQAYSIPEDTVAFLTKYEDPSDQTATSSPSGDLADDVPEHAEVIAASSDPNHSDLTESSNPDDESPILETAEESISPSEEPFAESPNLAEESFEEAPDFVDESFEESPFDESIASPEEASAMLEDATESPFEVPLECASLDVAEDRFPKSKNGHAEKASVEPLAESPFDAKLFRRIETIQLSESSSLHLVSALGRLYIIGVTPQQVNLLKEIEPSDVSGEKGISALFEHLTRALPGEN